MKTSVFNNSQVYPHGWYWALPSKDLAVGGIKEIDFLGCKILLFRGDNRQVYAQEPYCPHMGAHLKEGKVEGTSVRCGFHGWKFSGSGVCEEAFSSFEKIDPTSVTRRRVFCVAEKYEMIWIHTRPTTTDPVPHFPFLEGKPHFAKTDEIEIRECHPTLILGGGVDQDHFLVVHKETTDMTGPMKFTGKRLSPTVIGFENTEIIPNRLLRWFYSGTLTYRVTYWYATTACAQLGPKWFPMQSLFAYRPIEGGRTIGLNIYVTAFAQNPFAKLLGHVAIMITKMILRKGGGEDSVIQNSIRFQENAWTKNSGTFSQFIDYANEQEAAPWPMK